VPVQAKTKPRARSEANPKVIDKIRGNKTTTSQIVVADVLVKLPWLVHGFSTRPDGLTKTYGALSLNLGFTKEDGRQTVKRNREIFLQSLGAVSSAKVTMPLVTLRQIHSDHIHAVTAVPKSPLVGDGVVTNTPGLVLGVQTADCLPVILVDPKRKAVGVFHAGWRGTLRRIVEKGVGEMRRNFGSDPRHLQAAIGPGIRQCCFEVGPEVRVQFEAQFGYADKLFREIKELDPMREKYPMLFLTARAPGHSELPIQLFLDLAEANRLQLLDAGLSAKNIHLSPLCTACRTDFLFSYRKENGVTGRMMAAVGIRA
jgi:purine-nucleoside/S-methyl-5'-thioadenosine phosphorylase / adenosine deaminase